VPKAWFMRILLADLVVFFHFLWIVFIAFGFVLALMRSRLAWLHLAGLSFSLVLNLCEWYCPLTHLENYLHTKSVSGCVYASSFVGRYIRPWVYPPLSEDIIRGGEILFVCLNFLAYAVFFVRIRHGYRNRR
jgi:hypothetical protein